MVGREALRETSLCTHSSLKYVIITMCGSISIMAMHFLPFGM